MSALRKLYFHPSLLVLFLLSFFSPLYAVFRYTLLFAALHEVFHLVAALCLHVPVICLHFLPYGCRLELASTDCRTQAKIAAAGPLGSLLLYVLTAQSSYGKINLALCLLNLLPALPLDGGRLLQLWLLQAFGAYYVRRILRCLRYGIAIFFCLSALILSSVLCGWIGLFLLFSKDATASFFAFKKATSICRTRLFCISETSSLLRLCRYLSPYYYALFHVTETNTFLCEQDILLALASNEATCPVSQIAHACTHQTTAHDDVI